MKDVTKVRAQYLSYNRSERWNTCCRDACARMGVGACGGRLN